MQPRGCSEPAELNGRIFLSPAQQECLSLVLSFVEFAFQSPHLLVSNTFTLVSFPLVLLARVYLFILLFDCAKSVPIVMVYLSAHKPLLYRSPSLYDLNPFVGRNGTHHQQQHPTKQLNSRYVTTLQSSTRCTHRRAGSTWAVSNNNNSFYGPSSCCIYDNNIIYVPQEKITNHGILSRKTSTSCSQLSSLGRTNSCYNLQDLGAKKLKKRQLCRSIAVVDKDSSLEHTLPTINSKSHRQIERVIQSKNAEVCVYQSHCTHSKQLVVVVVVV